MQIYKQNMKGATLMELMAVVGILGILSMMAIPNYKAYMVKAKTSVLLSNLEAYKLKISEHMVLGTPVDKINDELLNLKDKKFKAPIKSLSVKKGEMTVVANKDELGISEDLNFFIRPILNDEDDSLEWECTLTNDSSKLLRYVPKLCHSKEILAKNEVD
ncbi:MAG: pilin [Francisellaceae bacterium]|nr:pilin [Francisellaceae bacterium]